jgi:hypothetical protein
MDALQELFANLEVVPTATVVEHHDHGQARPFATAAAAIKFMLAGNATVTFQGKVSHFTYKLKASDDGAVTFVSLLNGPDNEGGFRYLGYIRRGVYLHGKRSKIGATAPAAKAFAWTYRNLVRGIMPNGLEVWHSGKCGRCGRKLTVPESVASGFGPECITHLH